MHESHSKRVDNITRAVNDLLKGRRSANLAVDTQPNDEIRQLSVFVNRLADALYAGTRSAIDLSEGRLGGEINCQLAFGGALKNLQAALRHLTWQAQRVAEGDFSQRVDFLGEFSCAFNWMVQKLDSDRQRILAQSAVLEAINAIIQESLISETDEEVAQICLAKAQEITGSKFGLVGEVNQDGRFDALAFSQSGRDACAMPRSDAARVIKNMKSMGVWGAVLNDGCSQIVNDVATHAEGVGTPEGHPRVTALLGVPLKDAGKAVGMIALGNKKPGYDQADIEQIESLSLTFVEAMNRRRTQAESERLQQELVEASRRAGMSEVATGVLHNVGNVLNSVNVSANLLNEKIRASRVSRLANATALMSEHADDLGAFITQDERGTQLPGYLTKLAQHLAEEQTEVLDELGRLAENIEHIKNIVSMQQSLAGASGVTESVRIGDVLADLLKLDAAALDHDGIRVVQEYDELPVIYTDKHKLLQILVNLLKNAKEALAQDQKPDKRLTMRLRILDEDRVQIDVADNGVGIPPEDLTKIFAHGFTTKEGRCGFGLHGCALAATEIGGSLMAHSDGLGRGATFTLELPARKMERSEVRVAAHHEQADPGG